MNTNINTNSGPFIPTNQPGFHSENQKSGPMERYVYLLQSKNRYYRAFSTYEKAEKAQEEYPNTYIGIIKLE